MIADRCHRCRKAAHASTAVSAPGRSRPRMPGPHRGLQSRGHCPRHSAQGAIANRISNSAKSMVQAPSVVNFQNLTRRAPAMSGTLRPTLLEHGDVWWNKMPLGDLYFPGGPMTRSLLLLLGLCCRFPPELPVGRVSCTSTVWAISSAPALAPRAAGSTSNRPR